MKKKKAKAYGYMAIENCEGIPKKHWPWVREDLGVFEEEWMVWHVIEDAKRVDRNALKKKGWRVVRVTITED